ncbi:hypothetical protein BRADI_2g38416v3 [Brachypodium distachyon]|uniref:Uncharacterized protein n=1 Tax=Brachypodium distachyon TaxID=15368 RepID=A0A0Q3MU84_BRADI|nr:hypothetical protein BRADI_2g38416v3 [Brachypodium distachyon]
MQGFACNLTRLVPRIVPRGYSRPAAPPPSVRENVRRQPATVPFSPKSRAAGVRRRRRGLFPDPAGSAPFFPKSRTTAVCRRRVLPKAAPFFPKPLQRMPRFIAVLLAAPATPPWSLVTR